jgi:hypothetical protein
MDLKTYEKIVNYSNSYDENNFYLTENDIADLDLFFVYNEGEMSSENESPVVKIIREPIFYFSVSSYQKTTPVFQLGADNIIGYTKGNKFYAGRIIINAFSNVPFINSIIATGIPSSAAQDLPPMDFYILNKTAREKNKFFHDLVIKNFKITSWNFEQGIETPGRFVVAEFIASDFQGIYLKDYFEMQLYDIEQGDLNPKVETFQYKPFKEMNKETTSISDNLLANISTLLKIGNKWTDYGDNIPTRSNDINNLNNIYSNFVGSGEDGSYELTPEDEFFIKGLLSELNNDSDSISALYAIIKKPENAEELENYKNNGIIAVDDIDAYYDAAKEDIEHLIGLCEFCLNTSS